MVYFDRGASPVVADDDLLSSKFNCHVLHQAWAFGKGADVIAHDRNALALGICIFDGCSSP